MSLIILIWETAPIFEQQVSTYIVLCHFRADPITGALNTLNGVLDLIGSRNVFPGVQECLLLHCSWKNTSTILPKIKSYPSLEEPNYPTFL